MKSSTYNEMTKNKDIKNAIFVGPSMENKKYDIIKIKREGMQISFEFPPKSARDQLIEQEVKAIISGELKEKSRKIYIS
ncbi:MAG: hypothetical protein E6109_05770 [Ruminococcus sp.]|nr:hypothetical protein [Ruminococcus sp.]